MADTLTIGQFDSSDVLVWTYHLQFCNFGASAAPGVGNDNTENYIAGSIRSDTTHHNVYVCTDNSTGAAVWQQVTSGGSSYTFADSLVNTAGTVTLVNDSASPSASQYYGTDSGSTLGYHNLPAASPHNLLDGSVDQDTVAQAAVKGTLIVGNATPAWDGLAVGNYGDALMADSTQTLGVKWVSLSSVYQPLNSYLTTISGGMILRRKLRCGGRGGDRQSNAEATRLRRDISPRRSVFPSLPATSGRQRVECGGSGCDGWRRDLGRPCAHAGERCVGGTLWAGDGQRQGAGHQRRNMRHRVRRFRHGRERV